MHKNCKPFGLVCSTLPPDTATTPFDYAPHSAIETFAAALEQPRTEGARPIHPKIGLWLAQKKYVALTWASQDPEQGFNEKRATESLQEVPHAHLSMLVDLAPPQTRLDLYYLAVTAKQMDSAALDPPPFLERLELPNLD